MTTGLKSSSNKKMLYIDFGSNPGKNQMRLSIRCTKKYLKKAAEIKYYKKI